MPKVSYLGTFLVILTVVISACADTSNLENALQVAQQEARALGTRNAEQIVESSREIDAISTSSAGEIDEVSTRTAGVLAEAQGAAQEAISAAEATSESISIAATLSALPDINYDIELYGIIDELDLNGIVIEWWHNNSGDQEDAIQGIIAEFNESNQFGIFVKASDEGDLDNIHDRMILGFSTGDIPNIVSATQGQMVNYQSFRGLVSFEPYVEHPIYGLSVSEKEDIFDAFLTANLLPQYDDQLFGFPLDRAMEVLYFNQDWLEELGFDGPPRSLKEFSEMACAAVSTESEDGNDLVGFSINANEASIAAYAYASGNGIYDFEESEFSFSAPETVDYFLAIQNLIDSGCAKYEVELLADQAAFIEGSSLFIQSTSLNLLSTALAVNENEEPFNWSVAPIPFAGYEPSQVVSGLNLSIPVSSPEEQLAAWLFIQYFSSPAQQEKWIRASNGFPVQASTAVLLESYFEENPAYQTAFELLKYGRPELSVSGYDEIRDESVTAYQRILEGEDPELVLGELDRSARTIIFQ
jgi:multiple sugar transport system substrate-binding protein